MGESGGGSLTGPRLHRFHQIELRGQDDRRRCVEETQDEGLRLQPGVRRQLLSANDPVHQPQRHLWTVLERPTSTYPTALRSPPPSTPTCGTTTNPLRSTTWTSSSSMLTKHRSRS